MRSLTVLLLSVAQCWPAVAQSTMGANPQEQADIVAEVIKASKAIINAFGADDPESYFAFFDPTATFIFHNSPKRLEDRAEYQQEWASWRRDIGFRVRSCTSSDQRVQLLGDVAILTHTVRTEITTVAGAESLVERETIVFERQEGQWLAVHEHLSPFTAASQ